jgi:hypothetical protein
VCNAFTEEVVALGISQMELMVRECEHEHTLICRISNEGGKGIREERGYEIRNIYKRFIAEFSTGISN